MSEIICIREATAEKDEPAIDQFLELIDRPFIEYANYLYSTINHFRESKEKLISLVAQRKDGTIIGIAVFSKLEVEPAEININIMILEPFDFLTQYEGDPVGTLLTEAGLNLSEESGIDAVVTFGPNPDLYDLGFTEMESICELRYPISGVNIYGLFMIKEISPDCLSRVKGKIKYLPPLEIPTNEVG